MLPSHKHFDLILAKKALNLSGQTIGGRIRLGRNGVRIGKWIQLGKQLIPTGEVFARLAVLVEFFSIRLTASGSSYRIGVFGDTLQEASEEVRFRAGWR